MSSPEATDDDGSRAGEIQDDLARALKAYSELYSEGQRFPPFRPDQGVTTTDAAIAVSQILHAADLEPFEIVMWEVWNSA